MILQGAEQAQRDMRLATSALCDTNRLMQEFLIRVRSSQSLHDIHRDAEATAAAVRGVSRTALYDVKRGS